MPEHCKIKVIVLVVIESITYIEKRRFATWKSHSKMPEWYIEGEFKNSRNIVEL